LLPQKLLQHQLFLQARFVDEALFDHSGQTSDGRQHKRMRFRSGTGQVYDAEYPTALGFENRRARAREPGEDVGEMLGTFDKERLASSDRRADPVRTDRLLGEDVARYEFDAFEWRGQGGIRLTTIEDLAMIVGDDNAHLHRAKVVYEFVNDRS
jgi:hypothetical protein